MKYKVGQRVIQTTGMDFGKHGVIVDVSFAKLDNRGIPNIGDGSYHPFDRKIHRVVRFDSGLLTVCQTAWLRLENIK